jgi:hypothetical protein
MGITPFSVKRNAQGQAWTDKPKHFYIINY